jgi:hypothetical protein
VGPANVTYVFFVSFFQKVQFSLHIAAQVEPPFFEQTLRWMNEIPLSLHIVSIHSIAWSLHLQTDRI